MERYRGRFAPSPTGPLHFGSLVAAVASYVDARAHDGEWQVRIDDLDRPRVVPGAVDAILRTLQAFGMRWDGAVVFQETRHDAYHAALHRLRVRGAVYPCACSRREIADSALPGPEGYVYPGTCRHGLRPGRRARALRLDTQGARVAFDDRLQGRFELDLERDAGDFVLYRADGMYAYQLAAAVDDARQGITDVVRGADLLVSTPRQIHIQRLLGLPTPRYAHVPIAADQRGEKLSKQTCARPVDARDPVSALGAALAFLGHPPPDEIRSAGVDTLWRWAIENWRIDRVPRLLSITTG